jgi:hypothetical protein
MAEMADPALPARTVTAVETRAAMARRIIDRLFLCGVAGVSSGFFHIGEKFHDTGGFRRADAF